MFGLLSLARKMIHACLENLLAGQVKSVQYETNNNSHIKYGNMLLKD